MAATRSGRTAQSASQRPASRDRWVVASIAALLGAAAVVAWAWSRRDRAAELVDRQRTILAATARLRTSDVDGFVREADCMTRQEATVVRAALTTEWRRIRQETIDRYFDAPESDRPALLDDDIARLQNYHRLLAALDPMDRPGGRPARPARGPSRRQETDKADENSRALAALYDAARAARARERGITLPPAR